MWFNTNTKIKKKEENNKIASDLLMKCSKCQDMILKEEFFSNIHVCPLCNFHHRLSAKSRIKYLFEEGSFKEYDKFMQTKDNLNFVDTESYTNRIKRAQNKSMLRSALLSGEGSIGNNKVSIAILDFNFMGGSMGAVVGEKVARAIENAADQKIPFISITASGGARMQEGIFSLMQMAKTCSALNKLSDCNIPYISIMTYPTTGGVTASFSALGDIIIAEPKALIGFAGPRVIEQTIRQKLPENFQTSEFLLEHGMIDMIIDRRNLKTELEKILNFFAVRG